MEKQTLVFTLEGDAELAAMYLRITIASNSASTARAHLVMQGDRQNALHPASGSSGVIG
jgi:hypothetical protein